MRRLMLLALSAAAVAAAAALLASLCSARPAAAAYLALLPPPTQPVRAARPSAAAYSAPLPPPVWARWPPCRLCEARINHPASATCRRPTRGHRAPGLRRRARRAPTAHSPPSASAPASGLRSRARRAPTARAPLSASASAQGPVRNDAWTALAGGWPGGRCRAGDAGSHGADCKLPVTAGLPAVAAAAGQPSAPCAAPARGGAARVCAQPSPRPSRSQPGSGRRETTVVKPAAERPHDEGWRVAAGRAVAGCTAVMYSALLDRRQ
jgi:hypothetical protein